MKKTFDQQINLSNQPIPTLDQTCKKFIEWVEPLLTEEEFQKTKEVVKNFTSLGGDGERLQNELYEWAKRNSLSNWTVPLWYDVYLNARYSLTINSNVFYLLEKTQKAEEFSQTHVAAALAICSFRFKSFIEGETLTVDLQKGEPLCMEQYRKIFSATRIPKEQRDEFKVTSPHQKHIIVLYKGSLFSLDIMTALGEIRPLREIKKDLDDIIASQDKVDNENIAVLTTMERNLWAKGRETLLKIHPDNEELMKTIDDSAFTLSLDDEEAITLEETSKLLLHGNGINRWVDKSLQFIVFNNGRIGINIEHTGIDGSPMARLIRYVYEHLDNYLESTSLTEEMKSPQQFQKLEFNLNDRVRKMIKDAKGTFNNHIGNTQTRVLVFDDFGKEKIKSFKVSPDAFIQLALQLAQYKLYGKCYSAYEAIMTRMFLKGRIDVLYGVSLESMEFIKHMTSSESDNEIKATFLRKAAARHVERANECRTGEGIDTHLRGLLTMYELFGKSIGVNSIPEIFMDKGYKNLTHSVVCTSTSSTDGIELAGYGPVVEDGFGIRYLNKEEAIHFNMTSRRSVKEDLEKMSENIKESLLEMANAMEKSRHNHTNK
ncbi:MAG: choline/carnitine O-acyltransferase [Clostridiaceae bacterium]|nr:choline/carnitine O-acyltransferase [Clostridiaceae bacterium]